jgi:hypothetical protein
MGAERLSGNQSLKPKILDKKHKKWAVGKFRYIFGDKNKKLGVFVRMVKHPRIGRFFEYEINGVLGTALGAVGKKNYLFLADMAEEKTSDVNLADLAGLIDALDRESLPFRNNHPVQEHYKVSSGLS